MTDFTQDLFARRRNVADGNTRVVSEGKVWYDSITNTIRVSDGHTPGGQIITGQSGSYTLPTATSSVKGGVQLGANIIATGASIDVLSPTRVSQLENDANYLSGAVLATYATQTFVTTQGYITSAALSSGNANVIAANSTIQSISANLGAFQSYANTNISTLTSNAGVQATSINSLGANLGTATTNISNLVTGANANITALLAGSVTTGPLTVDSRNGGYFANISGAAHPAYGSRLSWQFFTQTNPSGGPGSWILFPDSTTQITAYPGTSTSLTTFDANIGTLSLGNISTQANLGAYQIYANANIGTLSLSNISTQANIGAFYTYANTKIGTNTNGNLVVVATTSSTNTTTGALVVKGGIGVAGNLNASNVVASSGFTMGSQVFYAQGTNGFSVNENFDPSNNSGQTAYHFASGATRANIAFTLARTGQFTDGFGVYGTSADNTFVTFGEQSNTSFEWRKGIGIQPLNLSGGTQLMKLSSAGNLVIPAATASTSNTTGALVVGGGVGITGNINLVYNPVTAIGSAIQLTGKDTQGGTGFFDFLKATNTTSGATNPNKFIRLNSTGGLEVINSAYSATLLTLTDAGALSVASTMSSTGFYVNNKQAVNGPAFRAYIAGAQTITSGSQQKVIFGSETFDTNSNFASSTFTPTVEGYYQLNATVRIAGSSGTGEVMIILYKNGSEYARGTNESGTEQGASWYSMQVSDLAYANGSTDYFEIYIQQTSGGSRDTTAGSTISYFSGVMVRGA